MDGNYLYLMWMLSVYYLSDFFFFFKFSERNECHPLDLFGPEFAGVFDTFHSDVLAKEDEIATIKG